MRKTITIFLTTLAILALSPNTAPIAGEFALQGGVAQTRGYLRAEQIGDNVQNRRLDIWMTSIASQQRLHRYDLDISKFLHLIIVSDDFQTFLHVHPQLQADGHFLLDQRFPRRTLYHIYADAEPYGNGQQVFRFDLNLAVSKEQISRDLHERGVVSNVGPYTVRLSTTRLSTHGTSQMIVHILKNGSPATDLHPYLGASAHAVFINAHDLSYVHVHPMPISAATNEMESEMGSMDMHAMQPADASTIASPDMQLHVGLHTPGTYKLWLQFRGGQQLYTATFVITAL